jgi:hypothetical protein
MRRNAFYAPMHKGLGMVGFLTLQWKSVDVKPEDQRMCAPAPSHPGTPAIKLSVCLSPGFESIRV